MKFNFFHLLPESNLPFLISVILVAFFSSLIVFIKIKFYFIFILILLFFFIIKLLWRKDIIYERKIGFHTFYVQNGIKIRFYYFLLTEIIFFFRIFWIFFDRALVPERELGEKWRPFGLDLINPFGTPLLNSLILLRRAVSLTFSHFNFLSNKNNNKSLILTIILGLLFIILQFIEYRNLRFNIRDSIYGRLFFIITGFHGLHVTFGSFFLFFNLIRLIKIELILNHHLSFEFSIIYWHFVDIIWLYLYLFLYWWSF